MKIRMIALLPLALMVIAGGTVVLCEAEQNKGAQDIEIAGGKRGNIPFPPHRHKEKLKDGNICHSVFELKERNAFNIQ